MPASLVRHFTICCLTLCLYSACGHADDNAVIVTTCHFANAEWGSEMIERCVNHNKTVRAEVIERFAQHERILNRCRTKDELGWDWVKTCIERDVSAEAALASYPSESAKRVDACRKQFASLGAARVKACVDEP